MTVRVRFAPSPTGDLHIGGARTALFNWLFARHHGGKFVLRIEDTDAERTKIETLSSITEALRWLGLNWDEGPDADGDYGPYMQSQRRDIYSQYADQLLESGLAYRCFCTPEALADKRKQQRKAGNAPRYDGACRELSEDEVSSRLEQGNRFALRLTVPGDGTTVVTDEIRGQVEFENRILDDIVIVKSDGMPTYNFACVVDDATMQISHVIRGEEHLSNTPKQIMVFDALNLVPPIYAHVPMILAPDRSKLSKRHGATAVDEFKRDGYLPEAVVNYLALLGWSPAEEEREDFLLDELVTAFDLDRVAKTAAIYDVNKITWMNAGYIRKLPLDVLIDRLLPFLHEKGVTITTDDRPRLKKVIDLLRSRTRTLIELAQACSYFFTDIQKYEDKGWQKHIERDGAYDILKRASSVLEQLDSFDASSIEKAYRSLADELGIKTSPLFHATRVATTGTTVGASLFDTMEVLGRKLCVERMEKVCSILEEASSE